MKTQALKICSALSVESLARLINQYYYSENWEVIEKDGQYQTYNSKLEKTAGKIEFKRNKYTFYL